MNPSEINKIQNKIQPARFDFFPLKRLISCETSYPYWTTSKTSVSIWKTNGATSISCATWCWTSISALTFRRTSISTFETFCFWTRTISKRSFSSADNVYGRAIGCETSSDAKSSGIFSRIFWRSTRIGNESEIYGNVWSSANPIVN